MPIPTSGSFTSEQVRSEFALAYPMTSAQVAAKIGVAGVWTSDQLRGKSGVTVSVYGFMDTVSVGGMNRRDQGTFTVTVTGGTPTAYSWWVDDPYGQVWASSSTASVNVTGPAYRVDAYTHSADITVNCTVTVNGQNYTASQASSYTFGDLN
ncbi:hypothetical protein WEU32_06860 [Brevundimonas sp. BH3]|uniref:hypothetical protein n=1 Tax=Brevundimonas sp. BH3 TaxID=3133089 RepID=UPI00324A5691